MTLKQLRYIVTVADTGNITEAAAKLFIAQPSLTSAIRELENEYGITIFDRSNRGVEITPEGEEFLGYARQILEQTDLVEERYTGKTEGKMRFCVSSQHYSFAVEAFVELLRVSGVEVPVDEFCRNCPDELCDNHGYFYDPAETTIAIELENAGPLFGSDGRYTDIFKTPVPDSSEVFFYGGEDPLYHASRYYETFPEEQLDTLEKLIAILEERYGPLIILGHSDIQQISVDPGPAFPRTKFFSDGN